MISTSIHRNNGTPEPGSAEFWFHIVISAFLVLAAGVFSGWVTTLDNRSDSISLKCDLSGTKSDARSDGSG